MNGSLRFGVEGVERDGELVPGAGLRVEVQGDAGGAQVAKETRVIPCVGSCCAMNERVQELQVSRELTKRAGSFGLAGELERAYEAEQSLVVVGIGFERDPKVVPGSLRIVSRQGQLAAQQVQGGVVALCRCEQLVCAILVLAINGDANSDGNRSGISGAKACKHRLGRIVLAHAALVLGQRQPGPAVKRVSRDISDE